MYILAWLLNITNKDRNVLRQIQLQTETKKMILEKLAILLK